MNNKSKCRESERGGAAVKFLFIALAIILLANAGYNYIPVAYQGASFREEMDSAVVKGMAASGRMKPMDIVENVIKKAAYDNQIPDDAFVEIKPAGGFVQAHVIYSKKVSLLPFGLFDHNYEFEYVAVPSGYLLKE